jgi:hypothetical protein
MTIISFTMILFSKTGRAMVSDAKWQDVAKRLIKAELKRRDCSYKELAEKLKEMGAQDSAENIANKISRGGFSAAFLLQCLCAIGTKKLDLDLE